MCIRKKKKNNKKVNENKKCEQYTDSGTQFVCLLFEQL